METIGVIFAVILGLITWALFCLLPAFSLYNDYSESVGVAYFFLSTLLFSMSFTLNGIHREIKNRNEELYRQSNRQHR